MIDWLRRGNATPSLTLAGREIPVAIRRHPSAKRMVMRLAPAGDEIRITLPRWGRTADALDFAHSRRDWLESELSRAAVGQAPLQPGEVLSYRGEDVLVAWDAKAARRPHLEDGQIRLGGPPESLPRRLQRWLENEALALLEADLREYCALAAVKAPALRLSRAQRRWGSCASDGTIRINWRLVQAPDAVRRSVVAHEVAHLIHFDHGPGFHGLLEELFEGDIRAANRWLKSHGRSLYTRFG